MFLEKLSKMMNVGKTGFRGHFGNCHGSGLQQIQRFCQTIIEQVLMQRFSCVLQHKPIQIIRMKVQLIADIAVGNMAFIVGLYITDYKIHGFWGEGAKPVISVRAAEESSCLSKAEIFRQKRSVWWYIPQAFAGSGRASDAGRLKERAR